MFWKTKYIIKTLSYCTEGVEVIQVQSFNSSTIQDDMVDTPEGHKYMYALEYLTCLHHVIVDSCFPP
jgi:hypothetical protein